MRINKVDRREPQRGMCRTKHRLLSSGVFLLCIISLRSLADEQPAQHRIDEPIHKSVEELARLVRKSVVVVTIAGREGEQRALGSGFVVGSDGLIATNLHVIGEARPITVQFDDGREFKVKTVHASDRRLDLALLKIEQDNLPSLELGDSDDLRQGQSVVAVGNPHGLKHSVVKGVISGIRELDQQKMIQLAIPIEPGNSGGPMVDMAGRVQGILTIKSAVTHNLGFAVTVNDLKRLIQQPNPIPLSRWLTIGRLDNRKWKSLFGAHWQQRAGRIVVSGWGRGFGGRALCLSFTELPQLPFEIAVTVMMHDETGAAGLVFHSDGGDKHYGFYPSNGRMRLSRFDGSDVFTWKVLNEERSEHYRPGQWNQLKVRIEKEGKIVCSVNDHVVIESQDQVYAMGQVGLAKFRHTTAEFKRFCIAGRIPSSAPTPEMLQQIDETIEAWESSVVVAEDQLQAFSKIDPAALSVLRQRALRLDQQADGLRELAKRIHFHRVTSELIELVNKKKDEQINLAHCALLIAKFDDEELDIGVYLDKIDRMASEILDALPKDADRESRLKQLNVYLYENNGFHGSRTDYYHPANSYLNRVLDDREGIPITLSLLYMEVGRRVGLDLIGVGLPGHFMVGYKTDAGEIQLIDAFGDGKQLDFDEADRLVMSVTRHHLDKKHIVAASARSILVRMFGNLRRIAQSNDDIVAMLRYLDAVLAIEPSLVEERSLRAMTRLRSGEFKAAIADLDWFLEHQPDEVELDRIRAWRERLNAR